MSMRAACRTSGIRISFAASFCSSSQSSTSSAHPCSQSPWPSPAVRCGRTTASTCVAASTGPPTGPTSSTAANQATSSVSRASTLSHPRCICLRSRGWRACSDRSWRSSRSSFLHRCAPSPRSRAMYPAPGHTSISYGRAQSSSTNSRSSLPWAPSTRRIG